MNRIAITRAHAAGHRAAHQPAPPQQFTAIPTALAPNRGRAA